MLDSFAEMNFLRVIRIVDDYPSISYRIHGHVSRSGSPCCIFLLIDFILIYGNIGRVRLMTGRIYPLTDLYFDDMGTDLTINAPFD